MSETITIVRTVKDLREEITEWKKQGLIVGLVPTMGALHKGHLSLVQAVAEKADRIVVSIFVNPTQFGEGEDLDKYPRQEAEDCKKLSETSASLVFAPLVEEMYPEGHVSKVTLEGGITEILEGAERPGHFDGVATIVTKLLLQCLPDVAIFGEKDYQQLAVIRQFVRDLDIPTQIMAGKLIREQDGLAYSSRNAYLNKEERVIAGKFNIILKELVLNLERGGHVREEETLAANKLLKAGFQEVDYVSVTDPATLMPLDAVNGEARVLAVARIGGVRLLDNMAINA